ncbi:MAG: hypothetical protein ISR45_05985 [Rhodospirillales bacterium]|nr:hypothetical protein [Rhodospirillales bacterium]
MTPYYLLNRDRRNYNRLAREMSPNPRVNTHTQNRFTVNPAPISVSDMISSGTLHAVNAVERSWNRMSALFRA